MYLKTILIMNKNNKIFTVSPTIKESYALQQNKCIQVRKEKDKNMKRRSDHQHAFFHLVPI